jgi:uncharacterized protein
MPIARPWLLLLAVWALLWSSAAPAADVPSAPTEHVTDRVGVLSTAEREDLGARLRAYEQETGHQVVVWIDRTSGTTSTEEFAVRAFEAWKIGRKGLDDGVALFVFVDDRKVRIEVGYGLEDRVTDLVASRIIRDAIVPRIVAGEWDGAVRAGVEELADTIEGREDALPAGSLRERGPPPTQDQGGWGSWILMIALGIGFLVLLVTRPQLALLLLWSFAGRGGHRHGGLGGGLSGGGFSGGGGRSGGGGATGSW